MKCLIILLGYLTLTQAIFFNFWRRPSAVTESIPTESHEKLNAEELPLYNQIYSTNGFGYYPQIHYPTIYTHVPVQGAQPVLTDLNIPSGVNSNPIIVQSETPTFAEELKLQEYEPLHINEYGTPIVEKEIIQDEFPLPEHGLPVSFNNDVYLAETHNPSEIHLAPQFSGVPGQYSHSYTLSDGTKVFEEGHLKQSSTGNEVIVKSGHYEYINPNGDLQKVNWIADEDGFRVLE